MKHKEGKFSFLKVIYSLGFCLEDTERYILKCSKVNALIVVGLKLNIQKTKIMAYSPIASWQIDGETVEPVTDFILGAPKSLQMVIATMKLKDAYSLEGKLWPT